MGLFQRIVEDFKRVNGKEEKGVVDNTIPKYWEFPPHTILPQREYIIDRPPVSILNSIKYVFNNLEISTTYKSSGANVRVYFYTFTLNDFNDISKLGKLEKALAMRLQTKVNIQLGYLDDISVIVYRESPLIVPFTYYTYTMGAYAETLKAYIGQTLDNRPIFVDFKKSPHVLVAGATGSGKSVCLNTILCSLLTTTCPNDLGLILIDPKRVELSKYRNLPHLMCPICTEAEEAEYRLLQICNYMDENYEKIERLGKKSIDEIDNPSKHNLRHVLVVIDEFADLMLSKYSKIEDYVVRIAQKGRGAGIHLLIATQRPTRDVLKPLIKANMTTRIALQTMSRVDSQVILDHKGAEQLSGKGDALIKLNDRVNEERVQVAYIDDAEIDKIVNYWARQIQK